MTPVTENMRSRLFPFALRARGPEALRVPFARFAADYRVTGRFADSLDRLKERLADLQTRKNAARQIYEGACQILGIENDLGTAEDAAARSIPGSCRRRSNGPGSSSACPRPRRRTGSHVSR